MDIESIFEMESELRTVSVENNRPRKEMEISLQESDQEWILKNIEPELSSESKRLPA